MTTQTQTQQEAVPSFLKSFLLASATIALSTMALALLWTRAH